MHLEGFPTNLDLNLNDNGEMLHLEVVDDGSMLHFLSDQVGQLNKIVLKRLQEISDQSILSVMRMLTRIIQANPPSLNELTLSNLGMTAEQGQ